MSNHGVVLHFLIVKVKRRLTLFLDVFDVLLMLLTVAPLPDNLNKMLKISLDQEMISPFSLYPFRIPQDQYSSVFFQPSQ